LSGLVLMERCRFCSKFRHPHEFIHDSTVGMCWHCHEWHLQALNVLLHGAIPRGCQECGRSYEQLEALSPTADVRMCLHPKDGIWQILCGECSDSYERKRLDLYGDTPFGWTKKLKGAH
jgi:hypothetical protein